MYVSQIWVIWFLLSFSNSLSLWYAVTMVTAVTADINTGVKLTSVHFLFVQRSSTSCSWESFLSWRRNWGHPTERRSSSRRRAGTCCLTSSPHRMRRSTWRWTIVSWPPANQDTGGSRDKKISSQRNEMNCRPCPSFDVSGLTSCQSQTEIYLTRLNPKCLQLMDRKRTNTEGFILKLLINWLSCSRFCNQTFDVLCL